MTDDVVFDLARESGFDTRPYSLAARIKELLMEHIADDGTAIDSGTSAESADLWVWFDGREYLINIRPSRLQEIKEAN